MNPTDITDKNRQLHRIAEQFNHDLQGPARYLEAIAGRNSELNRIAEQLGRSLRGPAKYLEIITGRNSELNRIAEQLDRSLQGPAKYLEAIAGRNSELNRIAEQLGRSLQRPAKYLEAIAGRNSELHRIAEQINRNLLESARHLNAIVAKDPDWSHMMEQLTKQTQVLPIVQAETSNDFLENIDSMHRTPSPDALVPSELSPDLSFEKSNQLEHVEHLLEEVLDTIKNISATTEDFRAYATAFLSRFEKIEASNNRLAWIFTWLNMAMLLIAAAGFAIEIARIDYASISDDLSTIKASIDAMKADISAMRDTHSNRLEQLINDLQDGDAIQSQPGDGVPESEAPPPD